MNLTSTNFTLNDAEGVLSPQSTPFSASIAEKRELIIEYVFDSSTNNSEFWWVPALFLDSETPYNATGSKPTTYYFFPVTASTPDDTYQNSISIAIPDTQKNLNFEWKVSADRLTITVKLTFYMTADVGGWVRNVSLNNLDRLLKNAFDNPVQNNNDGDSVYGSLKELGAYLYTEFPETESTNCSYTSDATTATLTRLDGGSFLVDGLALGMGYNAYIREGSVFTDIATNATISAVNHNAVSFIAGGGSVIGAGTGSGSFFQVTDGTRTAQSGSATQPNLGVEKIGYNRFSEISGQFYSEGFVSSPSFILERAGDQVTDLSSENTTDLTLQFDASATPTDAIIRLIRTNEISNADDFESDYELTDISGSVPTLVSGSTYETTASISAVTSNAQYRLVAVIYDTSGNQAGSLLSGSLGVTNIPAQLAIPDINTFVTNYSQRVATASATGAGVYERLRLELEIDKASYDATNVQGGSFDLNLKSVKITQGSDSSTISSQGATWIASGILSAVNSPTKLNVYAVIRVKREWIGQQKEWLWELGLDTEPTVIRLKHRVSVASPDELDTLELANANTDVVLSNFYEYPLSEIKAIATLADSSTNVNVAGLLTDGNTQEEDFQSGELIQLNAPDISNLTQLTAGSASFLLNFPSLSESGTIAFLSFIDYQLILTTDADDIELFFGGDPSLQVTMFRDQGIEVAPLINAWWSYTFGGASQTRTLLFRFNNVALLDTLKISRQDKSGNNFQGQLDLSKLTGLTTVEAQNNIFDSFEAGSFLQNADLLLELHNNNIDINATLQEIDDSNQGATASNRIVSLYGNAGAIDLATTAPLVQDLEALGFLIELALWGLQNE